jgi:hypothetical protein
MENRNFKELTITQNGGLYAMQHRALRKFRSPQRKKAVADKVIRIDASRPKCWPIAE